MDGQASLRSHPVITRWTGTLVSVATQSALDSRAGVGREQHARHSREDMPSVESNMDGTREKTCRRSRTTCPSLDSRAPVGREQHARHSREDMPSVESNMPVTREKTCRRSRATCPSLDSRAPVGREQHARHSREDMPSVESNRPITLYKFPGMGCEASRDASRHANRWKYMGIRRCASLHLDHDDAGGVVDDGVETSVRESAASRVRAVAHCGAGAIEVSAGAGVSRLIVSSRSWCRDALRLLVRPHRNCPRTPSLPSWTSCHPGFFADPVCSILARRLL
jgi:hypothetical protein